MTPKQIRAHVENELGGFLLLDRRTTPKQFADGAAALQTVTGAALPVDFHEFLKACGCYGVSCHIPHAGNRLPVSIFFGFDPSAAYNIGWNFRNFAGRVPANSLPFAMDDGGDLFLLDLKSGKVSSWSHETERATPIYADFQSFFEALEQSDDDEEDDEE